MNIIIDILRSWKHGFTYKTGAEPWFYQHCKKERIEEIVKALKNG